MRYINLLDSASHVKTRHCFVYNNAIIFAVPKVKMSKAIGADASNIRKLQNKLGKKVRIVREPEGVGDMGRFVSDIVVPAKFKSIEVREGTLFIKAGSVQNKATLMGRNKKRMGELGKIVRDIFNLGLRIV